MPEQRVYLDMLGRDIRTAVRGFEGNWINRDKRYDAAGRVEAESQPYMQGSAPAWTQYSGFDELNRPGQKVTHDDRLTITYQYSGLSTDINAGGLQIEKGEKGVGAN